MKRKVGDTGVEELRPGEPPAKINSRWTNDELLMAVTAVRKYGMCNIYIHYYKITLTINILYRYVYRQA